MLQGYQEIKTPQLVDLSLWEKSGHADKFGDDMFTLKSEERELRGQAHELPLSRAGVQPGPEESYRDLPLRLAEFGSCHRNEPSGSLHGIMRVRGFVQDDAHIFCTEEQIQSGSLGALSTCCMRCTQDFGFSDVIYRLSTRPEKRVGSDEGLGQGRERPWRTPWTARACPGKSCPARVRSTGPRSSSP